MFKKSAQLGRELPATSRRALPLLARGAYMGVREHDTAARTTLAGFFNILLLAFRAQPTKLKQMFVHDKLGFFFN